MNETTQSVKIGDIFEMSWGYDQTNVNFFQVTRLTLKGVYVREISMKSAGNEGFMCQNVVATENVFLRRSQWCGGFGDNNPETFFKLKKESNGQPYFSVKGRYIACRWDKTPTYQSWYA